MKAPAAPVPVVVIDPGEAWASVIGVKAVLSKRVEKITVTQAEQVPKVAESIIKRAAALVNDAIVPPALKLVDYDQVLQQTSEDVDEGQIQSMIAELPPAPQLAYMTVAHRSYDVLKAQLPKASYSTYAGTQTLPPDPMALMKFSELFAALDDPVAFVFGAMADGSLDRDLVPAVKAVFPTVSKAITSAIFDACSAKTLKNRAWMLPARSEVGVSAWNGLPLEVPAPSPPQKPPSQGPSAPSEKADLGDSMTPTEKIEAGK